MFKSLLKSYQSGIDALTKRAKIAENSFLAVYRTLAEAPDPYPLLEVAVDSILTVERVKELQAENSALRTKLAKQADYDSISQKLRNADSKLEMTIQQKVKTRESELLAVVDEKEKNWMDREASLQQQLQEAREATKDLRVSKIIEEKLNTHNDPERNIAGQLAETDIVLRDLERVNMRMIQVEQRNSDLRSEIAGLQTGAGTSAQIDADNLGRKLANLEADYDALARKFESDKSIHKEREGLTSDTLKKLEKGCRLQEQEIEAMKQKIRDKADYDELKRELNILKQIEFSIDDEQDSSSRENVKQHSAVATTLESLLVGRNQKLSDELTHMRVSNNELLETVTDLKTDLDLLNQELAEQKALSAKLENDLMRVNENSHPGYAASVAPSRYTSKTGTGTKRPISPTTSIIGYREDPFASLSKANELETGILPIITQQRDRFRNKVAELEGELGKQANTVLHLKNEIQSLQRDNTQMYERIRYLSQYSSKTSETDIAVSIGTSGASSKQAGDGTFGRYRSAYEISKNPFEAFRSKVNRFHEHNLC